MMNINENKKTVLVVYLAALAFMISAFYLDLYGTCGVTWKKGNVTAEVVFREVAFGNGIFVTVGDDGDVYTSYDGKTWTKKNSGFNSGYDDIFGVAYGNGVFVASMRDGRIIKSTDNGSSWKVKYKGEDNVDDNEDLYGVAYENGLFVVVGETGWVYISKNDGETWTKYKTTNLFRCIASGGNTFAAGTGGGSPRILTSTNGESWTQRATPACNIRGICCSGSRWIAVGYDIYLCQQPDAKNWTRCLRGEKEGLVDQFYSAGSTGSMFIAGGEHGLLFTSDKDGIKWTKQDSGTKRFILGIEYGNGVIAAVGNGGPRDPDSIYLHSTHYSECGGGTGPGVITVTSPNGGEMWEVGSLQNITWTSTGDVGDITIDYSIDNGLTWILLDGHAKNDGDRGWDIPNKPSNMCLVRVKKYITGTPFDVSDSVFSIISPNRVTLTSPNGGENWEGGTTHDITWTYVGTVGDLKIEYSTNNGASYNTIVSSTANDGSYPWDIPKTIDSDSCIIRISEVGGQANDVSDSVFTIHSPPEIALDRSLLNFGYAIGNGVPGAQSLGILNEGGGTLNWSITSDVSWLNFNPALATGEAYVDISINPTGLVVGTYTATVTVSDPNSINLTQTAAVNLTVKKSSDDQPPFGSFATPNDGIIVSGSIPVTGWVLDDVEVQSVKLYYNNSSYIGDAVFVEGARPDIEQAYPLYPQNSRAGWGYMLLTNSLLDGIYKLYAIAADNSGKQMTLGESTITIDNANAVKPFGAIDTPPQGGEASGSNYVNWGWALTPQPNMIPTDGSTIFIFVDGVSLGNPYGYNVPNTTIATLFPGYANSDGPVGYLHIDTTKYQNGIHTISWTVTDNGGNSEGVGSRYFSIRNINTGNGSKSSSMSQGKSLKSPGELSGIPADYSSPVWIKKGYKPDIEPQAIYPDPDEGGVIQLEIRELERIEIQLNHLSRLTQSTQLSTSHAALKGYLVVGDEFRPLPIGSTLDSEKGIFSWQPGHGFLGSYELLFVRNGENGALLQKRIHIRITPKFPVK
jgi:photosystem II stability/assembly factor-like uncharacterized protein